MEILYYYDNFFQKVYIILIIYEYLLLILGGVVLVNIHNESITLRNMGIKEYSLIFLYRIIKCDMFGFVGINL
jgi:hypothetical protein